MRKATKSDKNIVKRILSESFLNNKSVNYIIKQDQKKFERLQALVGYSFEMCSKFGEIFLSSDRNACALILYPDKKKTDLESIGLDVQLIFQSVGLKNISKTLHRESLIKKNQKKYLCSYLWFIGVNPKFQHQGTGSRLLKEVIEHSQKQNRNILLETSTLENLPWYERHGFHVYNELDFGYPLYFLERTV